MCGTIGSIPSPAKGREGGREEEEEEKKREERRKIRQGEHQLQITLLVYFINTYEEISNNPTKLTQEIEVDQKHPNSFYILFYFMTHRVSLCSPG
jgi:hypothetical protein